MYVHRKQPPHCIPRLFFLGTYRKKTNFFVDFFESSLIYLNTTQAHFPFQSNLTALTITSLEIRALAILHLAFFHHHMKFLINTQFFCLCGSDGEMNLQVHFNVNARLKYQQNIKVNIKQCTYIISFPLSFPSPIADWHYIMTSMIVKACASVWGSLVNACPQSPLYKRYDAIGGTVYILNSETID